MIVLGIIGIIADMTIPTLTKDVEKQVTLVKLKKQYSVLNQGFMMYLAMEGVSSLADTGLFTYPVNGWGEPPAELGGRAYSTQEVNKIFKTVKNAEHMQVLSNHVIKGFSPSSSKTMNGLFSTGQCWLSPDGVMFALMVYPRCNEDGSGNGDCGYIYFDLNGAQKPNRAGRDVFAVSIWKDGTVIGGTTLKWLELIGTADAKNSPNYWKNNKDFCGTDGSKDMNGVAGTSCLSRIIENGWTIDYY